jgi:hypothetical protein
MRLVTGLLLLYFAAAPKPLEIVRPALRQTDDGPASSPGVQWTAGETVFFTCHVGNFQTTQDKKIRLSYRVEAEDPDGLPIAEPAGGKTEEQLSPEDKDWLPKIRQEILIPPLAPPGVYKIRVVVKDEIASATAVKELAFEVAGHRVEPSGTLTVRNLRFQRSEDDVLPMPLAAYRPGETVWARFDITGYKLGPKNLVDVAYFVKVTAPSGKVLFTQPEPTVEKDTSFYPKRYVPCLINLSLQANILPGDYTITIHAEDRVGGQVFEAPAVFHIEK